MHDASSHLASDGTPEAGESCCQTSEITSSMIENEDDMMFIYAGALCESCYCVPPENNETHPQICPT